MTPQEALAQALHIIHGGDPADPPTTQEDVLEGIWSEMGEAAAILSTLPEGWVLIESDPYGTLADFRRRVEKEERERLRARYRYIRSEDAGPYVYRPDDLITVALMDTVILALLSDPEPRP